MTDGVELDAWLRLTLAPGIGSETKRQLLSTFGLPSAMLAAGPEAVREIAGNRAGALFTTDVTALAELTARWLETENHHFITLADPCYPPALLEIPDPPLILHVRGRLELLQRRGIAIVGSRNATPPGIQTAERFAQALAAAGQTIVSGLALGIDAAAHRGALAADGDTVAVIGTGADRLYPARNRDLALAICERGAIVSEFPLGTPALAANFPRRNRLISGLARGVLVVEAALESGSLITARLAAEQGRDVFAIPGSIHSPVARGCHRLIKQGAKLVETAADILEELPALAEPLAAAEEAADNVLLAALGHDPCTLDELAERTGIATDILLGELLSLELGGQIAQLPGNRYQRLG